MAAIQTTILLMAGIVVFINFINEIRDKPIEDKWNYYMFGAIVVAFSILNVEFFKILLYLFVASGFALVYKLLLGFDMPAWLAIAFILTNWRAFAIFAVTSVFVGALNKLLLKGANMRVFQHVLLVSMAAGWKYGAV